MVSDHRRKVSDNHKVTPASTAVKGMLPRMGVSVSVLASGSRGNCAIVCSSSTRILVDAGISCRETFKRMKAAGGDPRMLSAVLITHEHSDHVYGLRILAKKLSVPIFMTGAAHQAWTRSVRERSEEHTSELQSRQYLVCRLLLRPTRTSTLFPYTTLFRSISCRETFKRMKAAGGDPRMLSAVLITHEHSDHVYGLRILAKKLSVPIFMTGAAHQAWTRSVRE